jgi:hypothetical protein
MLWYITASTCVVRPGWFTFLTVTRLPVLALADAAAVPVARPGAVFAFVGILTSNAVMKG